MDTVIDRIDRRLRALKMSARKASLDSGMSADAIRTIRRNAEGNPGSVPRGSTLIRLARTLRTTEQWLLTGEGEEDTGAAGGISPAAREAVRRDQLALTGRGAVREIPVIGSAAGAVAIGKFEGFNLDPDAVIGFVQAPPALVGARDAYAFYVSGSSMSPMHSDGELRFAQPGRPFKPGDSVVIQVRNFSGSNIEAYVKTFLGRKPGGDIVAQQLKPAATLQFAAPTILAVHRILTLTELFEA